MTDEYKSSGLPRAHHLTSVYWGFFSGGARNIHTDIIRTLQDRGISNRVISYYDSVDRGTEGIQYMEEDPNYKKLCATGVTVDSLGLTHTDNIDLYGNIEHFSGDNSPSNPLEAVVRKLAYKLVSDESEAILSLKEQPVNLLVLANRYIEEVLHKSPKPLIITLHRTDPGLQDPKAFEKLKEIEHNPATKKYIAGYIACAESAAAAYQNALRLPMEAERFTFIPNGVDLNIFYPRQREEICALIAKLFSGVPSIADSPIVTIGARNSKEKNIGLFLESAYLFLRAHPEAHVLMCGSGMDAQGLQELMYQVIQSLDIPASEQEAIQARLHPIGRVSSNEMAVLCSMSNVVALTSPTLGEADPLVLKEGILCGAVPVTTSTGDTPQLTGVENPKAQILRPVTSGFIRGSRGILTSQNPQDIATAWEYAISHPNEFKVNIGAYLSGLNSTTMSLCYNTRIHELVTRHNKVLTGDTATPVFGESTIAMGKVMRPTDGHASSPSLIHPSDVESREI
jgi:glycosyltransferase involved in cell wall biosynthesis